MSYDVVIRGGQVCTGDLEPMRSGDIAVKDGRIAEIGKVGTDAKLELDASGLVVAPGFIDIHSHSDYTLLSDPRAMSAIYQGVTLEVVGNCGFGCAPLRPHKSFRDGIYGYNGTAPLEWENFSGYFDALVARQPAINVMSLAPFGQLRRCAVPTLDDRATDSEVAAMETLLAESLDEGCCGLSTGLEYPVERAASAAEITRLARYTARRGGFYATHTRARGVGALPAIEEAIRTAAEARAHLQISHIVPRKTDDGEIERSFDLVEKARRADLDVTFDMHTRAFGTTMLNTLLPPWITSGSHDRRRELLMDSAARQRMRDFSSILSSVGDWSRIVLLDIPQWPQYSRMSLAEIAAKRGQNPLDSAFDLLAEEPEDGPPFMVILLCYTPEQQATFFSHPDCIPASDATTLATDGPLAAASFHGAYTWASWFYRFMVRERQILSTEEAVHRMTAKPADVLRLQRRGRLRPNMMADIIAFDPEVFSERGTTFEPNALAAGMKHVLVNGLATLRDGLLTGERGGRILRDIQA